MHHHQSDKPIMALLKCLFVNVDLLEPLAISIDLLVDLGLPAALAVAAAELWGAPHLVGVELVGAAELVSVTSCLVVNAVKQRVACLEA